VPLSSDNTRRTSPASCDFRLTATGLAGGVLPSRYTVPEIAPSLFGESCSWALTLPPQANSAKLKTRRRRSRPKVRRKAERTVDRVFVPVRLDNLHCISTCSAL